MGWLDGIGLLTGETVTVIRPNDTLDELGEPIEGEPTRTEVSPVLVTPGGTEDMAASRPEGITVALTLGFPKTFTDSLRGCSVEVRGKTYKVIGDPEPLTPENISGEFNYTVEVTRNDG